MGILPFSLCLTNIIYHVYDTNIMQEIARIVKNGNSLSVNITRLCRMLNLDVGDKVLIDVSVPDFTDTSALEKGVLTEENAINIVRSIFKVFGKKGLFHSIVLFRAYEMGLPDSMTNRAIDILIKTGELKRDSDGKIWHGS